MSKRSSYVQTAKIISVNLSSVFQIGDSRQISALSRVIAYQKEVEMFDGTEPILQPVDRLGTQVPFTLNDQMETYHAWPAIHVNNVRIKGISVASMFHIGNSNTIDLQTRVKHQRQLSEILHSEEVENARDNRSRSNI